MMSGPVAKIENGRGMGRAGPHVTTAIRGKAGLTTAPICPFLGSVTNFATGPAWLKLSSSSVPVAHWAVIAFTIPSSCDPFAAAMAACMPSCMLPVLHRPGEGKAIPFAETHVRR